MFTITRLSDYSTTVLKMLAQTPHVLYSASQVAELTCISAPTVSKVLKLLNEAGLVRSTRGVNGGYQLAKDPNLISVRDIIAAIDGEPAMTDCCKGEDQCTYEQVCLLSDHWKWINKQVSVLLSQFSLADMCRPVKELIHREYHA